MGSFTFDFSADKLAKVLPNNDYIADWYANLATFLSEYFVNSEIRIAMFLAQTTHESLDYTRLYENLNYRATSLITTWPKYFNYDNANEYEHNPEKIANHAYANRMGNGDEASGEGWKYRGRGIIQITGKSNYAAFSQETFGDNTILDTPDYLETFEGAVRSACWFWKRNHLNDLTDKNDVKGVTKRINGGLIGLDDRIARFNRILPILQG